MKYEIAAYVAIAGIAGFLALRMINRRRAEAAGWPQYALAGGIGVGTAFAASVVGDVVRGMR